MSPNFLKKIAVIGDVEDVLQTGAALAYQFGAVRPSLDKLEADFETLLFSPSFDGGSAVVADAKDLVAQVEATYGASVPQVVAFKSAVAKLVADLA